MTTVLSLGLRVFLSEDGSVWVTVVAAVVVGPLSALAAAIGACVGAVLVVCDMSAVGEAL